MAISPQVAVRTGKTGGTRVPSETMNSNESTPIVIDGARGEGGGQVLRTSLSLSLITGRPLRIENIRARRKKPGLMRQHLTAVRAAAAVGDAETQGAGAGSRTLEFRPRTVRGGDFTFAIGTAGSCTLVLQTVLPALLGLQVGARIHLSGGTHNPYAPPADFLQRAFLPLLRGMGADIRMAVLRHGFYPAGGGELLLEIAPVTKLRPLHLRERGLLRQVSAEALIAGLPVNIAERELDTLGRTLGWDRERLSLRGLPGDQGPGNALLVTIEHEHVTEVFSSFGEKGVSAEKVAGKACRMVQDYLAGDAPVGPHLADQLLLPLAVAGGVFITRNPTTHTLTNLETIQAFLPGRIVSRELGNGLLRIESVLAAGLV